MIFERGFSGLECLAKRKETRRDRFGGDWKTAWASLVEAIEPYYPKGSATTL